MTPNISRLQTMPRLRGVMLCYALCRHAVGHQEQMPADGYTCMQASISLTQASTHKVVSSSAHSGVNSGGVKRGLSWGCSGGAIAPASLWPAVQTSNNKHKDQAAMLSQTQLASSSVHMKLDTHTPEGGGQCCTTPTCRLFVLRRNKHCCCCRFMQAGTAGVASRRDLLKEVHTNSHVHVSLSVWGV